MTRRGLYPEDLSVGARRGLLSEAEERELEHELERDPALRVAHAVGVDFDRSAVVRTGDEDLVSRAADAALARVARSGLSPREASERASGFRFGTSSKRRRTMTILLSAALVFVTGIAAAVWSGVVPAGWLGRSEKTTPGANLARELRADDAPRSLPPVELAPPDVVSEAETEDVGAAVPHSSLGRAPAEASAPALFRAANAARRDGDFERAKRAYSQLIARYPSSDEARLARVSLGKLLLAKGNPSDAEHEFDQYLKGGHGQLAEEALVSRAQSLQKLGRADAERLTWQRLVAEYPNSVYSAEARGRLDALRRGGVPPAP